MDIISIGTGVVAGGAVAWVAARSHFQARAMETERRAGGLEAQVAELRRSLGQKESETVLLRDELGDERRQRVEASTRFEESQKALLEQRRLLKEMEAKLGETFKAISLDALSRNSSEFKRYADEFIKIAEEKLKGQATEGKKELENKKELIDQGLDTIAKSITEVQKRIEEVGKGSGERFAEVATLIRKHEEVTQRLKETTDHLKHALASSKKRGDWGERMAEDIIRLIGMVEGINYLKQKTLESSAGRPDYTFLMPNGLKINMDVKFPLDNYTQYLNAESEHDRRRFKEELLKNTRTMIRQVTNREYINPAENTVDYVIIFVPNEQVYSFINEADIAIMDEALRQKVILCSPFTLYAVLAVIRQAVENFNLEQTASEILKLLGEFSKQWTAYKERFTVMGERLDGARKEYELLMTTRSNMLERPLRKIDELRRRKEIDLDSEIKLDEI
ncbi:MAG: DNA recombination protein RmuC [Thermodesulfovibrionales bacterium]|jgi:DNA recombination protein RmuC